ncbi:PEGA domain-containing protein [Candidatus Microgenomates bacterium]|nr:PEGA domain-containing protein [Candidatus Microgenomates bacterium]
MKSKLAGPIFVAIFIFSVTAAIVLFGRGFRVDLQQKELKTTGLLAATSNPKGASIFINNRLTSATNETINLDPGWYDVRIEKEGFIPWQKKIEIKKEIVAETNAHLFSQHPSLSPLTSTGAKSPSLSPDGLKLAYIIPYQPTINNQQLAIKYGVFILNLNNNPLSFSKKSTQIFSYQVTADEKASLVWSPDSTQVLFVNDQAAFLLDLDKKNESPQNLINNLPSLFSDWEIEHAELEEKNLLSLPEKLTEFLQESTKILSWSPDETKILYQATTSATLSQVIKPPLSAVNPTQETREIEPDKIYVYDRKEDRNYEIIKSSSFKELSSGQSQELSSKSEKLELEELASEITRQSGLHWLPTSRHLILPEDNSISIIEYDNTNKATVYASPFEENFVAPFPNGDRLIILTTLNPTSNPSNLYSLSLK